MKLILGIDPGLATVGYGLIRHQDDRYRYVAHGVLRTSPDDHVSRRLLQIHRGIEQIIRHYHPDEAGVEQIYFARNSKTALPVAQARGVILLALAQGGVEFGEYTPLELKQAVIGRGRADKRQIQEVMKVLLKLEEIPRPDHAADALAAAFCHANYAAVRARLASYEGGHV